MNAPTDNGYISNYLIHWTGTKKNEKDKKGSPVVSDEEGARVLSIIASDLQLLLSPNPLYKLDWHHGIQEKMVCFTDVPLCHSKEHCGRYGRFGIAFRKKDLMCVGAQPVFYALHNWWNDLCGIYEFIREEGDRLVGKKEEPPRLPPEVFYALHGHFYYIKEFSREDCPVDGPDAHYYEREWRVGELALAPDHDKHCRMREGYPLPYTGRLVENGGEKYLAFEKESVAFLVAPESFLSQISNPHGFPIEPYENLVTTRETTDRQGRHESGLLRGK